MRLVPTTPALTLGRAHIEANTGEIDPAAEFAAHADAVRQALQELAELTGASVET